MKAEVGRMKNLTVPDGRPAEKCCPNIAVSLETTVYQAER